MTELEQQIFKAGFVRDPNMPTRWYTGNAGKLEPVSGLEIFVTSSIQICAREYGGGQYFKLMDFGTSVQALEDYLKRNGRPAEAASAFSNSWD